MGFSGIPKACQGCRAFEMFFVLQCSLFSEISDNLHCGKIESSTAFLKATEGPLKQLIVKGRLNTRSQTMLKSMSMSCFLIVRWLTNQRKYGKGPWLTSVLKSAASTWNHTCFEPFFYQTRGCTVLNTYKYRYFFNRFCTMYIYKKHI